MNENIEKGRKGEMMAKDYLVDKNYKIRAVNYRSGRFEIDIIAEKDNRLIFIEVKTRQTDKYGFPEVAINHAKAQNILYAAEHYIYRVNWKKDIRFDVISILLRSGEIKHIEDAFY